MDIIVPSAQFQWAETDGSLEISESDGNTQIYIDRIGSTLEKTIGRSNFCIIFHVQAVPINTF